ncbi:MAG: FAD-dependent oxidoreductase [Bacilli bacterium]|nr:FAD-dependent oxidoreductase [Clostridium sp.]MDY3798497.1 FAD-dependent oxidoreductase [Bacilli bacterium]
MYDSIIIGAGPAGMTAAIYLARANKKVLIIEKETIGGQISSSPLVENYPGYEGISGSVLANNMYNQVDKLGVDIELDEVTDIIPGELHTVKTLDNEFKARTVIIATGVKYRLLGLENEIELIGNGIHFCVSCDGAFYKGKHVAVVGGGNTGIINALALADMCEKVYLIQDKDKLTGEKILQDKLKQKVNVEVITNSVVSKIIGDDKLEKIIIKNGKKENEIIVDGMFISIGLMPQSDFLKGIIDLDKFNYAVSFDTKTKIDGIFVAGDIRTKPFRQITTAVNDGTTSALYALEYLDN